MPRTLKLTIAYDGTNYAGWQRQINGARHPAGPRRRDRGDRRRAQSAERRRPHRLRRARRGASREHHDRSSDPVRRVAARAQRAPEGRRHPHPRRSKRCPIAGTRASSRKARPIATRSGTARRRARSSATSCGTCRSRSISIACSARPGADRRTRLRRLPGPQAAT